MGRQTPVCLFGLQKHHDEFWASSWVISGPTQRKPGKLLGPTALITNHRHPLHEMPGISGVSPLPWNVILVAGQSDPPHGKLTSDKRLLMRNPKCP